MSSSLSHAESHAELVPFGWSDRWLARLHAFPDTSPARVLRHDGASLLVATVDGPRAVPLSTRLDPAPTVGDWVALDGERCLAVLPRASLLRRRSVGGSADQALAANVDLVLLVCGLDRPVKPGRLHRSAALAWDAGAQPAVVLTKAALADDADAVVESVERAGPGLDVVVTSALEGVGLDEVRALVRDRTVAMLGESGAGKSSLVNALAGEAVAVAGDVRAGDAKGRHTTTARELHLLPTGGVLIDTPGLREVGLWVDPDAVDATFADIDELGAGCRFGDCRHDAEPGCAVLEAVDAGTLAEERLDSWRALRREAEAAALRADVHERRRHEKRFARVTREAQRLRRR